MCGGGGGDGEGSSLNAVKITYIDTPVSRERFGQLKRSRTVSSADKLCPGHSGPVFFLGTLNRAGK